MRTEEEITESAKDKRPFSNGTEGYAWQANWCDECKNNDEETELWCPLLTVALLGKTPTEWIEQPWQQVKGAPEGVLAPSLGDTYHCTEFSPREEGGDEPAPDPVPPFDAEMPGQTDMFGYFADEIIEQVQHLPAATP